MAKIRETEIERDADGDVIGQRDVIIERPRRGGGGFGWGMLLGVLIVAVGIIAFAYNQGSFQSAGANADRGTAQAEQQLSQSVENVGDAAETAGDRAEAETDRALN